MTEPKHKRWQMVGVRLTSGEYAAIKREAKRLGGTLAQALRHRALRGLTVVEPEAPEASETKAVGT